MNQPSAVRWLVWTLVIVLLILHQDNWLWNDSTLIFGFIPVGLFYHACISLAASCTWYMATRFAWPIGLENEGQAELKRSAAS